MTRNLTVPAMLASCVLALCCLQPADARAEDIFRISAATSDVHAGYTQIELAPGERYVLADLAGPGKVTYFYYTDGGNARRYRGLVLEVYWDDAAEPSIRVPLADFFGAFESHSIDYESRYLQVNHFCHMSTLPMPFARRARFVMLNDGDQDYSRAVAWGVDYEKSADFAREKSRLHAAWYRSNPVQNGLHPMLRVKGRGHYVGSLLHVETKYSGWWGEGNTLLDLDGRRLTHSEGTEDEYGSTWGFERSYNYLHSGYVDRGEGKHFMYRWYFANPIRFQESLSVTLENRRFQGRYDDFAGFEDAKRGQVASQDDYTSVVFWYQEGAHGAPAIAPYAQRVAPSNGATYPDPSQPPQ